MPKCVLQLWVVWKLIWGEGSCRTPSIRAFTPLSCLLVPRANDEWRKRLLHILYYFESIPTKANSVVTVATTTQLTRYEHFCGVFHPWEMSELTLHLNGRRVLYARARWLSQARREKREECRQLACLDATAQLLTATTHSWLTPNIRWKGSRGSESTQALTGWRLDWCFNIWNSNLKLFECGISDLSLPDERSRQYLLIWGTTHLD